MRQINVENVALGYDNRTILEQLHFHVDQGDYLCILGENGSGKTTLMKTLLHLQSPKAGTITMGEGMKATDIGYLPQQNDVQKDFPATVREIVLSGLQGHCGLRPFYNKKEKQIAQEWMERMGVARFASRSFRELSGGQQQRVLLARALCATKKILLLDEPVAGLDPKVTADMYELIKQLNDEGVTIIMISHDVQAALDYATHILHIGKTVFFGTKEDYMHSDIGTIFITREGV